MLPCSFPHGENPFLSWIFFSPPVYLLSNHISFYQLQLDRYRHPSANESQEPSTSPEPSDQVQERGRPKLKTKTLDGSALDEDVDTSMQQASSPRHNWGDRLEGSFMVIIYKTHVKKL